MKRITLIALAALCLFSLASCSEKESELVKTDPGKGITRFALLMADNPTLSQDVICSINEDGTITGQFPDLLEDYKMIPTFELDCEYLSVDGALQLSGFTMQDFANKITYEAKMKDGTVRKYTVQMAFQMKKNLPVITIKTLAVRIQDVKKVVRTQVQVGATQGKEHGQHTARCHMWSNQWQ